jgi:hypothetical protein
MTTQIEILDEGSMTPEQLKRNLDGGYRVEAKIGDSQYAAAKRSRNPQTGRECYAFFGPTGTHAISIDSDAARIHSHWNGYVELASMHVSACSSNRPI